MLKFCENCFKSPTGKGLSHKGFLPYLDDNDYICPYCNNKMQDTIPEEDYMDIVQISGDTKFIKAMIDLNEKDPIEYQLKMATIRNQIQQQKQVKTQQKVQNIPHCPTCGSTNIQKISETKRWLSTGLFGLASSDVGKTMVCKKCGYKF